MSTLTKPGPDTLLDEELAHALAERVEFGLSVRRAAISMGVNPNTAHRWMRLARLGIMPYAEWMYAVLEAKEKWTTDGRTTAFAGRIAAEEPAGRSRTDNDAERTRELVGAPR